MRKKLLSIVLVILTLIITNFSFAIGAKDFSVAMDNETMGLNHEAFSHHNNIECEVMCDGMMSCSGCIAYMHLSNLTEIVYQFPLKKLALHSAGRLYCVDLPHEHKPPIFS